MPKRAVFVGQIQYGSCVFDRRRDFAAVTDDLPVLQQAGNVVDEEMFRVYNMGVGFTVVVDPGDVDRTLEITRSYGAEAYVLGYAVPDARRRVNLEPVGLVGEAGRFRRAA